jgi:competence protein ComEA
VAPLLACLGVLAVLLSAAAWYPPLWQPGYAVASRLPLEAPHGGRIDVNTATLAELTTLPGIGEVRAQALVDYRQAHGPFETPEQLLQVHGIGPKTLAGILELIVLG